MSDEYGGKGAAGIGAQKEEHDVPDYDKRENVYIDDQGRFEGKANIADSGDGFFPPQYYANPFYGKDLSQFFREGWTDDTPYEKELKKTAEHWIQSENVEDMLSGESRLHPFLEVGGALRTQVPLPTNMVDLYSLYSVVLGANERNTDTWKMESTGFTEKEKLPLLSYPVLLGEGKRNVNGNEVTFNRSLLIWDDVAGASNKEGQNAPNFLKFICSIIFQQSDISAYGGNRGRYGPAVVRRLIDGHAYPNQHPHRTVTVFAYDDTGFPYGFYNGVILTPKTEILNHRVSGKKVEVGIPTLLLNYTFCVDRNISEGKTTEHMISHLLAFSSAYVTGVPVHYHLTTIHTDKCAASKSTAKTLGNDKTVIGHEVYLDAAKDVWKTINVDQGKNRYHFDFPGEGMFTGLVYVDESTVPYMDEGEEVPRPSDYFYKSTYCGYRKIVYEKCKKLLPKILENGALNQGLQSKAGNFLQVCEKHGVEHANVVSWLRFGNTLNFTDYNRSPYTGPVLGLGNFQISRYLRLNYGRLFEDIDTTRLVGREKIQDELQFRKDLAEVLRYSAKYGNAGNTYHWQVTESNPVGEDPRDGSKAVVPRLTDFGFIIVGNNAKDAALTVKANTTLSNFEGRGCDEKWRRIDPPLPMLWFDENAQPLTFEDETALDEINKAVANPDSNNYVPDLTVPDP